MSGHTSASSSSVPQPFNSNQESHIGTINADASTTIARVPIEAYVFNDDDIISQGIYSTKKDNPSNIKQPLSTANVVNNTESTITPPTLLDNNVSTNSPTKDLGDKSQDSVNVKQYVRTRRTAVSSESVNVDTIKNWKPPVHEKTLEEEQQITKVLSTNLNVLFGHLSESQASLVAKAMQKKHVPLGTELIKQGDKGDYFYIVESGRFDILVSRCNKPATKVMEATRGMSFGELALMYNSPRAATCVAMENSLVWALDGESFRMLLVTAENTKKKQYESLLENVDIFKCLNKYEISQLCDILKVQQCKDGECIVKQGDLGDRFYIVESGELVCKIKQDNHPEIEVQRYTRGGYFGELALIVRHGVRKASVYSVGDNTRLLWIGKATFDRVLGPVIEILKKNADKYPTYLDIIKRNSQQ